MWFLVTVAVAAQLHQPDDDAPPVPDGGQSRVGVAHLDAAAQQLAALQQGLQGQMATLQTLAGPKTEESDEGAPKTEEERAEDSEAALQGFMSTLNSDKLAQQETAVQLQAVRKDADAVDTDGGAPSGTLSLAEEANESDDADPALNGFSEDDAFARLLKRNPNVSVDAHGAFDAAFRKGQAVERKKLAQRAAPSSLLEEDPSLTTRDLQVLEVVRQSCAEELTPCEQSEPCVRALKQALGVNTVPDILHALDQQAGSRAIKSCMETKRPDLTSRELPDGPRTSKFDYQGSSNLRAD